MKSENKLFFNHQKKKRKKERKKKGSLKNKQLHAFGEGAETIQVFNKVTKGERQRRKESFIKSLREGARVMLECRISLCTSSMYGGVS